LEGSSLQGTVYYFVELQFHGSLSEPNLLVDYEKGSWVVDLELGHLVILLLAGRHGLVSAQWSHLAHWFRTLRPLLELLDFKLHFGDTFFFLLNVVGRRKI